MTGPMLTEEVVIRIRTLAADEAKRVLAGVSDELKKQRQGSQQAVGDFQRLAQAQRTVTADFRAGLLSAEAYREKMQQLRTAAIELRNTGMAPAGKELSAFSALMTNTATTSAQASRVLITMRNSLANVAATALGTSGKFGVLAASMLPLGVTSTSAILITAGVAAIAKGIEFLGARAEASAKRIETLAKANRDFVSGLNAPAGVAAQLFQPGEGQTTNLIEQQSAAELALRRAKRGTTVVDRGGIATQVVDPEEVERAQKALDLLNQRIGQLKEQLGDQMADATKAGARALADFEFQLTGFAVRVSTMATRLEGVRTQNVVGLLSTSTAQRAMRAPAPGARTSLRIPQGTLDRIQRENAQGNRDLAWQAANQGGGGGPSEAAMAATRALESLATSAMSGANALQSIAQAATSGITGMLAKSNPIASLLVGVGGGLLSALLGGGHSAPMKTEGQRIAEEQLAALKEINRTLEANQHEEPQPIIVFNGDRSGAEDAATALLRQTQRDRSPRIPRGAIPSLLTTMGR